MNLNRRSFIKTGTVAGFLGSTLSFNLIKEVQKIISPKKNHNVLWKERLLPKGLKSGSKVAITAPASPTSVWEIRNTVRALKRMDLEVEIGDTIRKYDSKYRYLSAPDEARAEEFMNYIESPDVDCILSGRGGYGVMRILPIIDYEAIRKNPKIIVGFSDITALLIAITSNTGLVTFHGPVAVATFNSFTVKYFKEMLFEKERYEPITVSNYRYEVINEGKVSGRLTGGNLTLITATLGTPYEINTDDAILFIEDVSTEPYQVDRMLTQLWLAGKFEKCRGVIFARFKGLDRRKNFYPVRSFTLRQVIESRMKEIAIPSMLGLEIGHRTNKITMPLGGNAFINTDDKSLTFLDRSVKS